MRYLQLELFPPDWQEPKTTLETVTEWSFDVFDKLFEQWFAVISEGISLFEDLTQWLTSALKTLPLPETKSFKRWLSQFEKLYSQLKEQQEPLAISWNNVIK
jgi:hypothetical protein